jgi:phospholipase/lecithinase/hemolysin
MRSKFLALLALVLMSPLYTALAGPINVNQLVVFGDSLSDNGNAAIALVLLGHKIFVELGCPEPGKS